MSPGLNRAFGAQPGVLVSMRRISASPKHMLAVDTSQDPELGRGGSHCEGEFLGTGWLADRSYRVTGQLQSSFFLSDHDREKAAVKVLAWA